MPGLVLAMVVGATTTRRAWWVLVAVTVALSAPTYGYTDIPGLNDWLFLVLLAIANVTVFVFSAVLARTPDVSPTVPDRMDGDTAAMASSSSLPDRVAPKPRERVIP